MLRTVSTLVIVGMTTLAAAAAAEAQSHPQSDRPADSAAIRAHIESIFQAFIDKDPSKLKATHGAAWRGFMPGSLAVIRGLDGYLNVAAGGARMPKGEGTVGYRIADFDVVFYGDTAIASFVAEVDVAFGAGKATQKLTLMDVYHKESSGWIQVASDTMFHPDEADRQMSQLRQLSPGERADLFKAREGVWRAWYAGDATAFEQIVPQELITVGPGVGAFGGLASALQGSRQFAASGARMTRLVFPRTEVQAYGATAILYTTYELDVEHEGKTRTDRGSATEMFVMRDGHWLHTGWQLSPAK